MKRLSRRPEYTFAYNLRQGRHGWLRLTPSYSAYLVEERLRAYSTECRVLDPFGGTGTTALLACERGYDATTVDINPFLVWLSRAKTRQYSHEVLRLAREIGEYAVAQRTYAEPVIPSMHDILRWWDAEILNWLGTIWGVIATLHEVEPAALDLVKVAFARCVITFAKASHNHPSLSFRTQQTQQLSLESCDETFRQHLDIVLQSARNNPPREARVLHDDARTLCSLNGEKFDVVITSPPYANRVSYIRELRPYMYWLGYINEARDAGELDWLAIGGTWGVATSRLKTWRPSTSPTSCQLERVIDTIRYAHPQNGLLMANYIAKYFEDLSQHIANLREILNPRAQIHYVVGNSSFYGIIVPVEQILAEIFSSYGFSDVKAIPIRKRNCKQELHEYEITGRFAG